MQGGLFNKSGLFITLKMLDTAFNLRSEALSAMFEKMSSQYGIILQRSQSALLRTNILTGNNTNFAAGLGDWSGSGTTWDSVGNRMKITSGIATIYLNLLAYGYGTYRISFTMATGSVHYVRLNGELVTFSSGSSISWTGLITITSGNLANMSLSIEADTGAILYVDNIVFEALNTFVNSDDGFCSIDGTDVEIKAFDAIVKDTDGMMKSIIVPSDDSIDFNGTHADGTWKVLAQVKKVYNEEGTIAFTNGSKNVTGTGTEFTKRLGRRMKLVIVDSTLGNDGVYEISTITDDTHLVLKNTYTGTSESDLPFSSGAVFPDVSFLPATYSEYRAYEMESYEFVVTQDAVGSHQIYLCDVVIAGGVPVSVEDKRTAFTLSPHAHYLSDITDFMVKAGKILGEGTGKAVDGATVVVNEAGELAVDSDGLVDDDTIEVDDDGKLALKSLGYQIYWAKITQSGTADPSLIVVKNDLDGAAPAFTRHTNGEYYADFEGGADVNKVFARINQARGAQKVLQSDVVYYSGKMRVWIYSLNSSFVVADSLLTGDLLEIVVMP
ncbi:MAG: hypothetical protein WC309_03205 [Candidatus Paceibacterota bacterium]|jgi:hypothetical protein